MNKKQLIKKVSEETGLSVKDVTKMLDKTLQIITTAVRKGDDPTITNFGRFTKVKRGARTVVNPKTKKAMKIPARWYLRFQSAKSLKNSIDKRIDWNHW
ncbi:HU family DNA-binding protein [Bdellovibrio sp. BCCA]|uniref:HU family DNA-binding protein n=1 Tax=Bdellovibrio sp. BCCA TaxID=3136281 RepID=UPI0030F15B93